jgi:hypothetical protein
VIRVLNINTLSLLTRFFVKESTRIKGKPDAKFVAPLMLTAERKNVILPVIIK